MDDQLKQARENLQRIREEYKDDPELLACYEPSAKDLVELLEKENEKAEDELVQYFIVNSDLNMSAGKIAAQVAHVATNIAVKMSMADDDGFVEMYYGHVLEKFNNWHSHDQPKIILKGKQIEMEKLIQQGWYYIRDSGRTEVEPNSLTVIGCSPEWKSVIYPIVKRFRLL